jgi:hypothetical protein
VKKLKPQNVKMFVTCRIASGFAVFICLFATVSLAQPTPKPVSPTIKVEVKTEVKSNVKVIVNESDIPAEKSIQTDAKVNVSLCIDTGKITINGWNRSEIRAFVSEGSQVGFKVRKSIGGKPALIDVVGFNPNKIKDLNANECLSGDEIELDVPQNAVINLKARKSNTFISNVAKVRVENVSGEITLRKISNGIEVTAYEGNVSVENSSGSITLGTTGGNILAYDVSANEIGDIFKVKTGGGAINLQNIGFTQVEANSTSGSIRFNGEMSEGGQYNFGTSNGSMTLIMPENSSCKVNATYSFGSFGSEIPYQAEQKSSGNDTKKLSATFGKGDATVNLTTFNGKILIKKR